MEVTNEEKKTHIIFKIMLAVSVFLIMLTAFALAICYFKHPASINFFTPSSLPPMSVVLIALYGFCIGMWGKRDTRNSFKYSKENGKGSIERIRYPRRAKSTPAASVSLLMMSLMLPFVFFFADDVKYLVGGITLGAIAVAAVVFVAVMLTIAGVAAKKHSEKEKAEAEKLRREQEIREQMGQWK